MIPNAIQTDFQDKMSSFVDSVKTMHAERIERGSDIKKELLIDIQLLMKALGEKFETFNHDQLTALNSQFSTISPTLLDLANDSKLWKGQPEGKAGVKQSVAIIHNLTDLQAIPEEVQNNPAFHGDALKHGLISLQLMDISSSTIPTTRLFAVSYAEEQLNKCERRGAKPGTAFFLLRPSSSVSSSKEEKVVTMSYKINDDSVTHIRLLYNPTSSPKPWRYGEFTAKSLKKLITLIFKEHGVFYIKEVKPLTKEEMISYSISRYNKSTSSFGNFPRSSPAFEPGKAGAETALAGIGSRDASGLQRQRLTTQKKTEA